MSTDALKALIEDLRRKPSGSRSFESLLTSVDGFGLRTASSLQRAIARIVDGQPLSELVTHPDVASAIGPPEALANLAGYKPKELVVVAGIRTGKSLMASALAVHWSQTCDVSKLGAGEIPRIPLVSRTKDLADVLYNHVVGNILNSPSLKSLLIEEPNSGRILLRHPSGKPIEIAVVAGSKAGASLVARWLAGCIFDEAPRMSGADEGVVNYEHMREAILGRILPGGQIVSIGSPWAPYGPIYDVVTDHLGKPTKDLVVVKAPGWAMNPVIWTADEVQRFREVYPDAYITDCAAEFASPEESIFSAVDLDRATRVLPLELPFEERHEYVAAMDPATRGNSWTLVICDRVGNKKGVLS